MGMRLKMFDGDHTTACLEIHHLGQSAPASYDMSRPFSLNTTTDQLPSLSLNKEPSLLDSSISWETPSNSFPQTTTHLLRSFLWP